MTGEQGSISTEVVLLTRDPARLADLAACR